MMVVAFWCWTGGAAGGGAPHDTGVGRTRLEGSLTVFSSGNSKIRPMTSDCSPNEVSVVQFRRVLRADELSSKLSANIVSSGMASSSEKSVC
jgi:hypothetical protein